MGGSPPLRTSEKYYYLIFCDGIHYVFLTPDDALKHAKRVAKEFKQNARVIQALNMYDVRRKNPGKAEVSSGGSCLCGVDFHVCGAGDYSDTGWTQTMPEIRLEPIV